jgi:hypothetical protein
MEKGDGMTTTAVRRHLTWMTCVDTLDHVITDAAMCVGMSAGFGEYRAVCGVVVLPAAMVAPPGRCCPRCSSRLRHPASPSPVRRERRQRHRRPSRWSVLLRRAGLSSPVV